MTPFDSIASKALRQDNLVVARCQLVRLVRVLKRPFLVLVRFCSEP